MHKEVRVVMLDTTAVKDLEEVSIPVRTLHLLALLTSAALPRGIVSCRLRF